jgi:hypothetical protein
MMIVLQVGVGGTIRVTMKTEDKEEGRGGEEWGDQYNRVVCQAGVADNTTSLILLCFGWLGQSEVSKVHLQILL